jgi:uncharacterized membrane protein
MSEKEQAVPAVGFLVMVFTDEKAADQALKAMKAAKKEKKFYFENAAVIRQDAAGKVHYSETGDIKSSKGAGIGALIGGVLGALGGPLTIGAGSAAGAALGAAMSAPDAGFRDESLQAVGLALKPGTSAVVAITSQAFLKAFRREIPIDDARNFVANLSTEISNKLNEGKSLALAILMTEGGLAMQEVAANEDSTEVIVMALTEDAVLAGQVIATEEGVAYQLAGATAEGSFVETGAATKDAALVVDDVVTKEGEVVTITAMLSEEEARKLVAEAESTDTAEAEAKPAEA